MKKTNHMGWAATSSCTRQKWQIWGPSVAYRTGGIWRANQEAIMKHGSFQQRFTTVSLLNCQSSQILTVLSCSSYACEESYPWNIMCLWVHVCSGWEHSWKMALGLHCSQQSKQSPKFGSDSQVYPSQSSMNLAVMVIFTLFEILYYVRYFQLPLLNTQHWFQCAIPTLPQILFFYSKVLPAMVCGLQVGWGFKWIKNYNWMKHWCESHSPRHIQC